MSWVQVISIFAMNMSAFMFAIRIVQSMISSNKLVPIIVTLWCPLHLACNLLLHGSWWSHALSLCSLFAVLVVIQRFQKWRASKKLPNEIIFLLNLFVLQMRSGKSISSVAQGVLKKHSEQLSNNVQDVLKAVAFSQHEAANFSAPVLRRFQDAIFLAEKERHLACLHLENLREEFSLLQHFRHRSGQATLQARMQSYICVGLYMFLLFLLSSWLGWQGVKPFFLPSLFLMLLGWAGLHWVGRKKHWKV